MAWQSISGPNHLKSMTTSNLKRNLGKQRNQDKNSMHEISKRKQTIKHVYGKSNHKPNSRDEEILLVLTSTVS